MTTPEDGPDSSVHHHADDARGVLYRGGPVVTVDPDRPRAEAVATRAGRIVAVGSEERCRQALDMTHNPPGEASDGPAVVELAGRALLPGFVDAYVHPLALCLNAFAVDLGPARSIADVLDLLSERARTADRSEWVVGIGLRPELLDERRLPVATELDKIADGQVVVVVARDGYRSAGSSVALTVAGIRNNTADPVGGSFERDHQSRLTGVCYGRATHQLIGMLSLPDHETLRDLIRVVGTDLVARGITSIGMGLQTDAEGYGGAAFAHEARSLMLLVDELPVGCHAILGGEPLQAVDARTASPLHDPERNRTVAGISMSIDGSLDGHGAWLREPYRDRPGHRGWPICDAEGIGARIDAAVDEGFQVSVRATGDAATALALDLFADLRQRRPETAELRHRVEHATLVDDATLPRFADLGVAAVLRPMRAPGQGTWLPARLGLDRARQAHPARRLVDAGALVAAASDAPVDDADVPRAIADLVLGADYEPDGHDDRGRPDGGDDGGGEGAGGQGGLRPDEAVAVWTRNAAAALGQDHAVGTIREGHRADLVVLSADPTILTAGQIADLQVCGTIVGGAALNPP
jgi:predicted amidohydrolase YtcJ